MNEIYYLPETINLFLEIDSSDALRVFFRGFAGYDSAPAGVLFPQLESLDLRGSYSGMTRGQFEEYRATASYRYSMGELVAGVDPHLRFIMQHYSRRGCFVQYGAIGAEGGRDSGVLWGNQYAPVGKSPFVVQFAP